MFGDRDEYFWQQRIRRFEGDRENIKRSWNGHKEVSRQPSMGSGKAVKTVLQENFKGETFNFFTMLVYPAGAKKGDTANYKMSTAQRAGLGEGEIGKRKHQETRQMIHTLGHDERER
jgi:hypothetical protein